MTTKKIMVIVGSVVLGLTVLIAGFLVTIVGLGLYAVKNSESAEKAKDYLRNNEKLKQDIGEVKDFGSIVIPSVEVRDGNNYVTLRLKVIGEKKTVNATVVVILVQGNVSRVASASYVNSSGQKIPLLDPYDTKVQIPRLAA